MCFFRLAAPLLSMPELISAEALAKQLGVSGQAVRKAHAAGRLTSFDGRFDPAVAKIQWEANRKRRRADVPTRPAEQANDQQSKTASPSGEGSDYWANKTRREAAEASIAELKLAELAEKLVLRSEVERVVFTAARVLRDQLLSIPPRLGATLAPIADQREIEERIAAELRVGLRAFAQQLRAGRLDGGGDGLGR